jgi:hypothetical protein
MASLIHELDNDALLLMYRADELSPEDRVEVEQMLAIDAGLRAALATVGRDAAAAEAALAAADHVDPPAASPSASAVALRRVGRAMRQWQVDRIIRSRPAPAAAERQPRFPAWAYPAAAAAALVLGSIAWWGFKGDNGTGGDVGPHSPRSPGYVQATPGTDDPAVVEPPRGDPLPILAAGRDLRDLDDDERQARTLARADDPAGVSTIVADGLAD